MKKLLNKVILIVALSIYIFANDEVLILDTSGSLSNISTVVEIKKLTERYLIKGKSIIAFNDDSYPVKSINDLRFGGGTATAKALESVLNANYRYVVIVTDGDSNDNDATIKQANLLKAKGIKICSVFLSSSGANIPETLVKISDKVFLSKDVAGAFSMCSSSKIKEQILGTSAVIKIVDDSHFNLF
jgi:hypothetical protein